MGGSTEKTAPRAFQSSAHFGKSTVTGFSIAYLAIALAAVKTQGLHFTMAWGTVVLRAFVAVLLIAAAVR